MLRIFIAGVVGGALVFCGGAFSHMVLNLEGRAFKQLAKDDDMRKAIGKEDLKPGVYRIPGLPDGWEKLTGEEKTKAVKTYNDRYREGPSGLMVVAPKDEDVMESYQLVAEFATNVLAALIAAWIVANVGGSYVLRWIVVLNLGLFTWLSTGASFGIWYRFPMDFVHDGLFCSLIEWGIAGFAIAAIATPAPPTAADAPAP